MTEDNSEVDDGLLRFKAGGRNRKDPPLDKVHATVMEEAGFLSHQLYMAYRAMAVQRPPADAKGFAAHQAACKAALAHLESLIKVIKWAEEEQAETPILGGDADLEADDGSVNAYQLIQEAREAIELLDAEQ